MAGMIDDILSGADQSATPISVTAPERQRRGLRLRRGLRQRRTRVHKLRMLFVLIAFAGLAVISLLFGVLTSIASDLPRLSNQVQFNSDVDSYLYDINGKPIGPLAPATKPAIDKWGDISQNMIHAIVAVEDKGFWHEPGIDLRGLLRAAVSDATGGQFEGGSTIPEEFVKNVNQEEDHRTILEKLVEAGMAFQLTHRWTHPHILTQYLNTIYFGNGALGIEAAARVYFGWAHGYDASDPAGEKSSGCGDPDPQDLHRKECASMLTPAQAALLAGMVANPTAYDPVLHPRMAQWRRNLVLKDMYEQHYLSHHQYEVAYNTPLPKPAQIQQPQQASSVAPYFTSWVEPLVVRALRKEGLSAKQAQYEAYYGGLKIRLSIDLEMQQYAQEAVNYELPAGYDKPSASLVAIDNSNGEVRAMVSGDGDYQATPFNYATLGYRQPGSAFKLFTLVAALSKGTITPYTKEDSHQLTIPFVKQGGNAFRAANGTGRFQVRNFGNSYSGWIPLTVATATSDNSVFAQVGMSPSVGTALIASYAKKMGIRSPISTNPSMILGGLKTGVSALDMAHAYSTEANGGVKVYNKTLGDYERGAIGIDSISGCGPCRQHDVTNAQTLSHQTVYSPQVANTIHELLRGPVDDSYGTGTAAAISGVDVAGKTGTTSNYVDAWFVGWTPQMTVAVWVGYPNSGRSMATAYFGKPVEGGTYPAQIWHNFMVEALQVLADEEQHKSTTITAATPTVIPTTSSSTGTRTTTTATSTSTDQTTSGTTGNQAQTPGSSATGAPSQSSSGDQVQTATTSTPPAAAHTPGTGANGGSGL